MFSWAEVFEYLNLVQSAPEAKLLDQSFNVAPTQDSLIVRLDESDERELTAARWGLIPSWADDERIGNRLINARSDGVSSKPSFRSAFKRRRCVVPVSGFYEWTKSESGRKQPWYIHRAGGEIMLLAGLWERWEKNAAMGAIESFTIMTTDANEDIRALHHRMPVVLERERVETWLDSEAKADALDSLMRGAGAGVLEWWPVSDRVNSPRNDDAELVERADPVEEHDTGGLFDQP